MAGACWDLLFNGESGVRKIVNSNLHGLTTIFVDHTHNTCKERSCFVSAHVCCRCERGVASRWKTNPLALRRYQIHFLSIVYIKLNVLIFGV